MTGALASTGIGTDDLDAVALERDGQCRLWWGDNAVDLFFAYDAIHEEMRNEVRRVPFAEVTLPILSPEPRRQRLMRHPDGHPLTRETNDRFRRKVVTQVTHAHHRGA